MWEESLVDSRARKTTDTLSRPQLALVSGEVMSLVAAVGTQKRLEYGGD